MKQGKLNTKLIPQPKSTRQPMLVRGSLLNSLVAQVNTNTIALRPPRLVEAILTQIAKEGELVEDTNATVDVATALEDTGWSDIWNEISKTTETVRVENPDDATQYVDISRRVASQFRDLHGNVVLMLFDNTDLEA